jgi:hypothetical protein
MEKRLKNIWNGMRQRCLNPKQKAFPYYGGRGISICQEWLNDFEAFESWALANGYKAGLTLDRRENDSNYLPSNCRFVDWSTQMKNRRNPNPTRKGMTYKNNSLNIKQLAASLGVCAETLRKRKKLGQSLDTPIRKYQRV